MKRIVDEEYAPDSPEHLLAKLVRATPRLEPSPFQRRRVLAGVTNVVRPGKKGPWAAAVTTVVVLAGATLAAAAVGHFVSPPHLASVNVAATSAAPLPEPPPVEAPAPLNPASDPVLPDLPATSSVRSAPLDRPSTRLDRPSTRLRATAPSKDGEDPTPVLEAIRALRYNGDPARAGVLLAQYLKAHPRSVLSEDASALSIEAAVARHDPRSAADLGRRYLAQFPNGRYRAFALQAAQSASP